MAAGSINVLVVGQRGQLAEAIRRQMVAYPDLAISFASRPALDLAAPDRLEAALRGRSFDVLVNAAAYTAVDAAEDERSLAMTINGEAPGSLARLAAERNAAMVHVSTDYVFSGLHGPRAEHDLAEPVNSYGRSKLQGERTVAANNPRHFIFRTAWLHGPTEHNFVAAILGRMLKGLPLRVVDDQYGNPTNVDDFADALLTVIPALLAGRAPSGIYHAAGLEGVSWYDFARAIAGVSAANGGPTATIAPIASTEYPMKATRPLDTRLDCQKAAALLGLNLPSFRNRLPAVVAAQLKRLLSLR